MDSWIGPGLEQWLERLAPSWHFIVTVLATFATLAGAVHVVLNKRDVRAAAGWLGLILLVPVLGSTLYIMLGINRIRRRGADLRGGERKLLDAATAPAHDREALLELLPRESHHLEDLARVVDVVTQRQLTFGNRVQPLEGGEEAYPAMLGAIDGASRSVALSTYIFDHDAAGLRFVEALAAATARGVEVRVLIDAAGARYSWPSVVGTLRKRGVRVARFLPTIVPRSVPYMNLRNHRKLCIVDGGLGFTGGMNIREGHLARSATRNPVEDLHFRLEGPVVAHLMHTFIEDWSFAAGEWLSGNRWLAPLERPGSTAARGITDGPDEDQDKLRWTLLGAIASARQCIRIVTPYFLPDWDIITSLAVAVLRGVEVQIVLPERNNLRLVQWASTAQLPEVVERGCRVFLSPPPFDHTKLMVVDSAWALVGSGNWDPRSLRLNFEFNVELYDPALARDLGAIIDARVGRSRLLAPARMNRSLPVRLRDGLARLLLPYL